MLKIKFDKMNLLHSYQHHGLKKSDIELSLEKGIKNIIRGKQNNKIIYTNDYTAIIVDKFNNFLTAYKSDEKQYNSKCRQAKTKKFIGTDRRLENK